MNVAVVEKPKAKTRPNLLLYVGLGAVVVYAIFLYTQPAPTTSTVRRSPLHSASSPGSDTSLNLTPQDLTAHFPRYASTTKRDPFAPLIGGQGSNSPFGANGASGSGGAGDWELTGINTVNGVLSALIENIATNESIFLQPGDNWKGLRVTDIDQTTVHFVNGLGQETTLTFTPPKVVAPTSLPVARQGAQTAVPGLTALPPLTSPGGAAYPVDPTQQIPQGFGNGGGGGGGRGGRGRRGGGGGGGGFGGGGG